MPDTTSAPTPSSMPSEPTAGLPIANPYPAGPAKIARVRYREALILMRLKDAAKMRSGEDAHYILGADYRVTWTDGDGEDHDITVPRGMLTDLTSVPSPLRSVVGRVGPWLEAAIVHDFLTIAWRVVDGEGTSERRRFADRLMWAAMDEADVSWWRRCLIFIAIRVAACRDYPQQKAPRPWSHFATDLDGANVTGQMAGTGDLPV